MKKEVKDEAIRSGSSVLSKYYLKLIEFVPKGIKTTFIDTPTLAKSICLAHPALCITIVVAGVSISIIAYYEWEAVKLNEECVALGFYDQHVKDLYGIEIKNIKNDCEINHKSSKLYLFAYGIKLAEGCFLISYQYHAGPVPLTIVFKGNDEGYRIARQNLVSLCLPEQVTEAIKRREIASKK